MPYINMNTNVAISNDSKISIKSKLGKAIELLGKSESWLMIGFEDKCDMYFKGSDAPAAFVDISVFGKSTDSQCEKMTAEVCKILGGELGLPADRIYVKYTGTSQWGWNNMSF